MFAYFSNKWFCFGILFLLMITGCRQNPLKPDVSGIKVDIKISRLDQDLFKISPSNRDSLLPKLKRTYGDFYNIYTKNILELGNPDDSTFSVYLREFLNDTIRIGSKKKVDSIFRDLHWLEEKLQRAFRYYKYHFPEKQIPGVYTVISGFNQSMITTKDALGISLDNYLGSKERFYTMLAIPEYKRINMIPEKIPSDAMYAWAISEFDNAEEEDLLSAMINQGKFMYFLDAVLPDEPDSLKIGYPSGKIEWCKSHENAMWTFLIENKLLFSNDRMNIRRFTGPAPFTNSFTSESPGKTGVWLGWQIVRKFMKKHPKIKLSELMAEKDYKKILNESGYDPQ
jgi:gliding motility-associated lipoprotein GldB